MLFIANTCSELCQNRYFSVSLSSRHRVDRLKTANAGWYNHRLLLRLWIHPPGWLSVPHQRLAKAAASHLSTWVPLHHLHLVSYSDLVHLRLQNHKQRLGSPGLPFTKKRSVTNAEVFLSVSNICARWLKNEFLSSFRCLNPGEHSNQQVYQCSICIHLSQMPSVEVFVLKAVDQNHLYQECSCSHRMKWTRHVPIRSRSWWLDQYQMLSPDQYQIFN